MSKAFLRVGKKFCNEEEVLARWEDEARMFLSRDC